MSHTHSPLLLSKDSFANAIAYSSGRALHYLAHTCSDVFGLSQLPVNVMEDENFTFQHKSFAEVCALLKSIDGDSAVSAAEAMDIARHGTSLPNPANEQDGIGGAPFEASLTAAEPLNLLHSHENLSGVDGHSILGLERTRSAPSILRDHAEPLRGCFKLVLLVRHCLIVSLREMAGVYIDLSTSLQYWIWSKEHRLLYVIHHSFTASVFNRISRLWSDSVLQQNSHILAIRRLQRIIISVIGSVFFLLQNLRASMSELQQHLEQVAFASNVERVTELKDCIKKLYHYLQQSVTVAEDVIKGSMTLLTTPVISAELKECHGDQSGGSSASDVFSETHHDWGTSPGALEQRTGGTSFCQSGLITSLLHVLRYVMDFTTEASKCGKSHATPFVARYGRLLLVAPALLFSSLGVLIRNSPEDLFGMLRRACTTAMQIAHIYGVIPAKSIVESLLYTRPGVDDRLRAFEKEAGALAKIIRDYHADYFEGMTEKDLSELQKSAFDALIRGNIDDEGFNRINQHYRDAVRHPFRGFFFGHLPRILLIRMSVQSLEVTRVVNGIDEVLENNHLNFQVMTIVPLLMSAFSMIMWTWWKWRWAMRPIHHLLRLRWREAHRILNGEILILPHEQRRTHRQDDGNTFFSPASKLSSFVLSRPHTVLEKVEQGEDSSVKVPGPCQPRFVEMTDYEQGLLLLAIHEMRMTVKWFMRSYVFYRELLNDLEMLESTSMSRCNRLEVLNRMRATHRFL